MLQAKENHHHHLGHSYIHLKGCKGKLPQDHRWKISFSDHGAHTHLFFFKTSVKTTRLSGLEGTGINCPPILIPHTNSDMKK